MINYICSSCFAQNLKSFYADCGAPGGKIYCFFELNDNEIYQTSFNYVNIHNKNTKNLFNKYQLSTILCQDCWHLKDIIE